MGTPSVPGALESLLVVGVYSALPNSSLPVISLSSHFCSTSEPAGSCRGLLRSSARCAPPGAGTAAARWQDSPQLQRGREAQFWFFPSQDKGLEGGERLPSMNLTPGYQAGTVKMAGTRLEDRGRRPPRQHPDSVSWRGARRARRLPSEAASSKALHFFYS